MQLVFQLTQFYNVSSDVLQTSINLLLHKFRRDDENVLYAQRVLRREACRCCKCITAMCSENPLVSFKTSNLAFLISSMYYNNMFPQVLRTYAPPELSDPAMTRTRFTIVAERRVAVSVQSSSKYQNVNAAII